MPQKPDEEKVPETLEEEVIFMFPRGVGGGGYCFWCRSWLSHESVGGFIQICMDITLGHDKGSL